MYLFVRVFRNAIDTCELRWRSKEQRGTEKSLQLESSPSVRQPCCFTRKPKVAFPHSSVCVHTFGHLSESRLQVYPSVHVLVAQQAGVGGQGIVGENGVVVRGAGAGGVLARGGVLLKRRRQVQVLKGRKQQSEKC